MGLDNIGPIDRSHLPVHGVLEQSDATGWMAGYALSMATMATILHGSGHRPALDLVQKFLEHFAGISEALEEVGLWDDEDGFFYDRILLADGSAVPVRVRSMVAMIPLLAAAVVNEEAIDRTLVTDKMFAGYLRRHGIGGTKEMVDAGILRGQPGQRRLLVGVTGLEFGESRFKGVEGDTFFVGFEARDEAGNSRKPQDADDRKGGEDERRSAGQRCGCGRVHGSQCDIPS